MATGCVFCKIAAGEIAATVVKRGDGMLAFGDLNPQAPTHLLVIPTYHVGTLNEVQDAGPAARLRARRGARGGDRGPGLPRGAEHEPRRRADGVPPPPARARRATDDVAAGVTSPPVRRDLPFVPPLHEVERGSGGEGTGGEVGVARAPRQG